MIHWTTVKYNDLNSRAKENFNYAKLSALLADYGYLTIRLSDDWKGADLLARHENGDILQIQLKSRLDFERKYVGKGLYIAFLYQRKTWYLYDHDELLCKVFDIPNTGAWKKEKGRSYSSIGKKELELLEPYKIIDQQTVGLDTGDT